MAAGPSPDPSRVDRTDLPLVTIDPPGATDLDQAMHIERAGDGYRVYYAIADVAAWVEPGGPIDLEAHRRGETLYAPEYRIPLHPPALSEAAASLLPEQDCPALLWTVDLDADGDGTTVEVERAMVRSRRQYDYAGIQAELDAGTAPEVFTLLRTVGELRIARERDRGGVSLDLPEQEVHVDDDGRWTLQFRDLAPVERWNAQISLLVGMGAAEMMMYAEVGILRTLPPADEHTVAQLRRTAAALGFDWPGGMGYARFIPTIDANTPAGGGAADRLHPPAARCGVCGLRYGGSRNSPSTPPSRMFTRTARPRCAASWIATRARSAWRSAATSPYPSGSCGAMEQLPSEMAASGRRSGSFERGIIDLVEAECSARGSERRSRGVVTTADEDKPEKGRVMVTDPAVEAPVSDPSGAKLPVGKHVRVTLAEASPAQATVRFEIAR